MGVRKFILSVLFPPVGGLLRVGCGGQFLLNVGLRALGYFPGLLHAIWLDSRRR